MTEYATLSQVTVETKGSALALDAPAGSYSVTVDYAGDFDGDGGTLDINGARLPYISITEGDNPDDPDVIDLGSPVPVDASTDDLVGVVEGNAIAEDWWAVCSMEDGDSIMVPIAFEQRSSWPVGDYDPPIPVSLSDDLQVLLDAPGRTPSWGLDPSTLPRLTAYNNVTYTDLGISSGDTGETTDFVWEVDDDISYGVGAQIVVSSTRSRVTITQTGVWSVSWSLFVDENASREADPQSGFGLRAAPGWTDNAYDALVRGGDPNNHSAVGSFTYYVPESVIGTSNAWVDFPVFYNVIDTDNLRGTYAEIMIQRVA